MGFHKLGSDFSPDRQHDVPEPDNARSRRAVYGPYASPYLRNEDAEGWNDAERCQGIARAFVDSDDIAVRPSGGLRCFPEGHRDIDKQNVERNRAKIKAV